MSTYVPRGQGGSVVIGAVYADMGGDKGNASAVVEVDRDGGIVLKAGRSSESRATFSVTRAEQVIELLQKGVDAAGRIDRLFAELKVQESEGLQRIYASLTGEED